MQKLDEGIGRLTVEYMEGVATFLKYVKQNLNGNDWYNYPCAKCCNIRGKMTLETISEHLVCNGIDQTYKIWFLHGEQHLEIGASTSVDNRNEDVLPKMVDLVNDAFGHFQLDELDACMDEVNNEDDIEPHDDLVSPHVVRAKKKDTGNVYALKIMDKKFITKENKISYVKLERIVLDQLDHPGIIRLFFTFQDIFSLYMALESCEGGELFDQITRKDHLSEAEACFYAVEVVDVLEYIHGVGLIHKDIKLENLLLTAEGHIKIANFGSVKPMKDSQITILPTATS
ncbi:3-phosphoinositide-dependent protein kinase 1-like [Magnolia sinica]|uniref:3-phosphoinositide-dependent protein kinase 1-like n=1 Tax=Magnolia sinica TaxID=86752 RepID=UPI00265A6A60|nr:3-phosphoinositide-dependent protein kinase 1-like [Magnolia sinica]